MGGEAARRAAHAPRAAPRATRLVLLARHDGEAGVERGEVRGVVHAHAVGVHGERRLDVVGVEVEELERRNVLHVGKGAPEEAHVGARLAHEDGPLVEHEAHGHPVHVVEQDVARKVAVGVARRHVLQQARADVNVGHRRAQLGKVFGLEVPRAALARVLAVQVAVKVVVVAAHKGVEEEVVRRHLDNIAREEVQLAGRHGDQRAPQPPRVVERRRNRRNARRVLGVHQPLRLNVRARLRLCARRGAGRRARGPRLLGARGARGQRSGERRRARARAEHAPSSKPPRPSRRPSLSSSQAAKPDEPAYMPALKKAAPDSSQKVCANAPSLGRSCVA